MIPASVWTDWYNILTSVWVMILSNPITSFVFGALIITIVANLIYRLTTVKKDES